MIGEAEFLTPAAAAQLLGISLSTLRLRIRRGEVKAYRLRRSRLIRLRHEDVVALLEPVQAPATALRVVMTNERAGPGLKG